MPNLAVDQIVLLSAAVLGALAVGFAFVAPPESHGEEREAAPGRGIGLVMGLVVAAALFLATLPARPPFSPGGRLGAGLIIGALSAAAMALASGRVARHRGGPLLLAMGL